MSAHRNDKNITELKNYFNAVIDWVSTVFEDVYPEMKGMEWGRLYEEYHGTSYNAAKLAAEVKKLMADDFVKNRKGIFEYLLGGKTEKKLLDIRVFETSVKRAAYTKQTQAAERKSVSNCPLCAIGHDAHKTKIWALTEMDADHVTAWSKGGATDAKNCQMLCIPHNRAKGNK